MHWHVPTTLEDANEGGTFYTNACSASGQDHTESGKRVTCKKCKALYQYPNTPELTAAKFYQRIIAEQEEGRTDDFTVEVKCNGCDSDLDVFGWLDEAHAHDLIARTVHFLNHVAHEHAWGSEALIVRYYTPYTAYELNYGMGKPAQTQHEEKWREREGLAPDVSDVGRASFEARIVEP